MLVFGQIMEAPLLMRMSVDCSVPGRMVLASLRLAVVIPIVSLLPCLLMFHLRNGRSIVY